MQTPGRRPSTSTVVAGGAAACGGSAARVAARPGSSSGPSAARPGSSSGPSAAGWTGCDDSDAEDEPAGLPPAVELCSVLLPLSHSSGGMLRSRSSQSNLLRTLAGAALEHGAALSGSREWAGAQDDGTAVLVAAADVASALELLRASRGTLYTSTS